MNYVEKNLQQAGRTCGTLLLILIALILRLCNSMEEVATLVTLFFLGLLIMAALGAVGVGKHHHRRF